MIVAIGIMCSVTPICTSVQSAAAENGEGGKTQADIGNADQMATAARTGDLATLERLLKAGMSANTRDSRGSPILTQASIGNSAHSAEAINLLIRAGANLEAVGRDGYRALHGASITSVANQNALLAAGANIEAKGDQGRTAIFIPILIDSAELMQNLINAGARIDALNSYGETPLLAAVEWGAAKTTRCLAQAGASVNIKSKEGKTPKEIAVKHGYKEIIRTLTAVEATNPGSALADMNAGLFAAVVDNDTTAAARLLKNGAQVDAVNLKGERPSQYAIQAHGAAMLELLLNAGAQFEATAADGKKSERRALLCQAVSEGNIAVVRVLLKAGAKVDTPCFGDQPIHDAATLPTAEIFNLLVQAGARADARNAHGEQPIHRAARNATPDTVRALLASHADLGAKDDKGLQPIHHAACNDDPAVIRLLLAQGADLNAAATNGDRPLHYAVRMGSIDPALETLAAMLADGADPQARNKDGQSPITLAVSHNSQQIIKVFETSHKANAQYIHWLKEREANKSDIFAATIARFDENALGYRCGQLLTSFPERYDNLDYPARAQANWDRAEEIISRFTVCAQKFSASVSGITPQSLVPIYRLLNEEEKTCVAEHIRRGIDAISDQIRFAQREIDEELSAIRSSKMRMNSAAEAHRRAINENRQWVTELTQSLNDLAERMKPQPVPESAYKYYGPEDSDEQSTAGEAHASVGAARKPAGSGKDASAGLTKTSGAAGTTANKGNSGGKGGTTGSVSPGLASEVGKKSSVDDGTENGATAAATTKATRSDSGSGGKKPYGGTVLVLTSHDGEQERLAAEKAAARAEEERLRKLDRDRIAAGIKKLDQDRKDAQAAQEKWAREHPSKCDRSLPGACGVER